MKIYILVLTLAFLLLHTPAQACTTAIISGKFTVDGRPLLYKHRDSGQLQNKLMYFQDGKYDYIGLVNSNDEKGLEVWAGTNSTGFAIMNSADYNLNLQDTTRLRDREGIVMKLALQSCATLEDFEQLLRDLPKPLGVDANFGVIDAHGGAAYYETGNRTFTKFDANDPASAPFGYIVRTNFAFTWARDKEFGLIRFRTAGGLFSLAANRQDLSLRFLLQDVSRSLYHSLTATDLRLQAPADAAQTTYVNFTDFIPRYSTAAVVAVQGIKPGESDDFTTMWTVLGWPLTSVAVPAWVAAGSDLPELMVPGPDGTAPLCSHALELKKQVFPLTKGSYKNYINLAPLFNQAGTGYIQVLPPLEKNILELTKSQLNKWRTQKELPSGDAQKLYQKISQQVLEFYRSQFGM